MDLARAAYADRRFRLASTGLAAFSHLMTSRQGLFAIGPEGCKLIAHGLFFGLVVTPRAVFLFESADLPRHLRNTGRIVRLERDGDSIVEWRIIAQDLSGGGHQMDLIDGRLHLVDTYNQRVRWFEPDGREQGAHYPLPAAAYGDWAGGYAHVNSLLAVRDAILLVLHNGGAATGKPSELAVLDRRWKLNDRRPLPGMGCHNLAVLEDGTLLTCASLSGELVEVSGERIQISDMMTRGLSISPEGVVVGASAFSNRLQRHDARGSVHILTRDYATSQMFALPGAPTDIRSLDAVDYSQSTTTSTISLRLR